VVIGEDALRKLHRAVFLVASYVNDRDLADPEEGVVIVQAE
jgi:hypothetical protein